MVLPWFYQLNVFKFQTDFGRLVFPSLMNIEHDEDKNSREKYFVEKEINVDSFFLVPITYFNPKLKILSLLVCPFTKQIRLPWVTVYYIFVF